MRDAAQSSFAFLGEPILAAQKTADIFKSTSEGGYKEIIFPSDLSAYQLVLPWLAYLAVKSSVNDYLNDLESEKRILAKPWLENGRLTVLGLLGDALREHYSVARNNYFPSNLSRELSESLDEWGRGMIRLGMDLIWQSSQSQPEWLRLGARATFRRGATYESVLAPNFLASFRAVKNTLAASLPQI